MVSSLSIGSIEPQMNFEIKNFKIEQRVDELYLEKSVSPLSLTNMPDVVMSEILGKLDIRAVQILRKVCHSLRSFIDDTRRNGEISSIKLISNPNSINVVYDGKYEVIYRKHEVGCLVEHQRRAKLFRKETCFEMLLGDLNLILGAQKTLLKMLGIYLREPSTPFLPFLKTFLESMPRPLSVETLQIEMGKQSEVMDVLPYLEYKKLKNIRIYASSGRNEMMEINRIVELDQWKMAEKVTLERWIHRKHFVDFGHLKEVLLSTYKINSEELIELKEMFLNSSTLQQFLFPYLDLHDYQNFLHKKNRYFRMKNSDSDVLNVRHIPTNKIINFNRLKISEVPKDKIIEF
ncbi:hypothetical protein CRE_18745 [Caenorhabditis remanei]|uniref:Uncharacterized protein n=1 Tax=Caenorhabditis remanei TaxID=31234 RepID=E3LJR6_CAERE|nr:hypothetical protein CRE_18745 [Caenorhabditis remanei]